AEFALTVGPVIDAGERIGDRLQFVAVTIGEDQVDLAIARVAREVVGIHPLVLAELATLMQIGLHGSQELQAHVIEGLTRLLQERLSHVPSASEGRRIYGVPPAMSTPFLTTTSPHRA